MPDTSFFITYVEHTSYVGIFLTLAIAGFAIPIPEEVMLLLVGYLAASGVNNIWIVLPISFISVLISDYIVFFASRFGGRLIRRWQNMISPQTLQRFEEHMRTHTGKTIMTLRFAVGLRFLSMFVAGATQVSSWKFILFDGLALCLYVPILLFLGYHFHDKISVVIARATAVRHSISLVLLAGSSLLIIWIFRHYFFKIMSKQDHDT